MKMIHRRLNIPCSVHLRSCSYRVNQQTWQQNVRRRAFARETSRFCLYFSGSSIPRNPQLSCYRIDLHWHRQFQFIYNSIYEMETRLYRSIRLSLLNRIKLSLGVIILLHLENIGLVNWFSQRIKTLRRLRYSSSFKVFVWIFAAATKISRSSPSRLASRPPRPPTELLFCALCYTVFN
jgi:hypothetical protein